MDIEPEIPETNPIIEEQKIIEDAPIDKIVPDEQKIIEDAPIDKIVPDKQKRFENAPIDKNVSDKQVNGTSHKIVPDKQKRFEDAPIDKNVSDEQVNGTSHKTLSNITPIKKDINDSKSNSQTVFQQNNSTENDKKNTGNDNIFSENDSKLDLKFDNDKYALELYNRLYKDWYATNLYVLGKEKKILHLQMEDERNKKNKEFENEINKLSMEKNIFEEEKIKLNLEKKIIEEEKIKLSSEKKIFEDEKSKYLIERNKMENEKVMLNDINSKIDKVYLDIGGKKYTTNKSTIAKNENLFSILFNGSEELKYDEEGYLFFDRDGKIFQYILNFLRDNKNFLYYQRGKKNYKNY